MSRAARKLQVGGGAEETRAFASKAGHTGGECEIRAHTGESARRGHQKHPPAETPLTAAPHADTRKEWLGMRFLELAALPCQGPAPLQEAAILFRSARSPIQFARFDIMSHRYRRWGRSQRQRSR